MQFTDEQIYEIAKPFVLDTENDVTDWIGFARALLARASLPAEKVAQAEPVAKSKGPQNGAYSFERCGVKPTPIDPKLAEFDPQAAAVEATKLTTLAWLEKHDPAHVAAPPAQTQVALTDLDRVAGILASEIECAVFERHVVPALDVARKVLAIGGKA